MASSRFYMKQGDTKTPIQCVLKDGTGAVVDLTSTTVKFYMRAKHSDTSKINGVNATIIAPANNGLVQYAWTSTDVDEPGAFTAEWRVDFGGGNIKRFPSRAEDEITIEIDRNLENAP